MQTQIYTCTSSFPYEIQDILREKGFLIEPLHEVHHFTNRLHGSFTFRITRGSDSLRVLGLQSEDECGFHIAEDPNDDYNNKGNSPDFFGEIELILLQNGACHGISEEL